MQLFHSISPQYQSDHNDITKRPTNQYQKVSEIQIDLQFHDESFQKDKHFEPSFGIKMFFFYMYFTQGMILALCSTMPYIYPQLPPYNVMAIFSGCLLPFSFKFLMAPIIQKYTYFDYGKRKFWIVLSEFLTSLCLFIAAFHTKYQQSKQMAVILFFAMLFMSLQDISLDSLAKKQLRHAHITSSMSVSSQMSGNIIGSMLLLKLSSNEFATYFGLKSSIAEISTIVGCLGLIILIPLILIHILFKETKLKREYDSSNEPLWEIFYSYRIFLNPISRYCRTIVFLLIINQGFNFFIAGYDYELVKAGFSRDTNNTIQNIVAIPINVLAYFMTSKIEDFGIKKGILVAIIAQLLLLGYLRVFFPTSVVQVAISTAIFGVFNMWQLMIMVLFIYQFPVHRYTGSFITLLASFLNLGSNLTLHTKILDLIGWWTMSYIGLAIQLLILLMVYFKIYQWREQGDDDLERGLSSVKPKQKQTKQDENPLQKSRKEVKPNNNS